MVIGVSALVMSFAMPAIGGINQAAATALFATFLSVSPLGKAFLAYLAGVKVTLHREWMIRAFSVGPCCGYHPPHYRGVLCYEPAFSGLTPHEFFGIAFWIGFVVHLHRGRGLDSCVRSRRRRWLASMS